MQQNKFNESVLGIFEFALGALVVYIGTLWMVDLSLVKATGYFINFIEVYSYINIFWIGVAIVALLIPLTLWKEKPHE